MKYRNAFVGVALVAFLAGGVVLMRLRQPAENLAGVKKQEQIFKARGPVDAPVQIIEYSDFECPACQRAQASLHKILETYPEKIHIVFRHFPLPAHRWSPLAHVAAECAARKGKFWEFHDQLYGLQQIWSKAPNPLENFLQYASSIGLNLEPFAQCLTDQEMQRTVLADKKSGDGLQVNSTPTFFINNQRLVGPIDLEQKGEAAIRSILGLPPLPPSPIPSAAPPSVPSPAAPPNPQK